MVAEVVPLKQGLKLEIVGYGSLFIDLSCRGSSIKTRIETSFSLQFVTKSARVAEVVPLKQGLKRV